MEEKPDLTLRDLYAKLSADELKRAEENLEQYLSLALRIHERVASEPKAYARFRSLTANFGTVGCTPRSNPSEDVNSHGAT